MVNVAVDIDGVLTCNPKPLPREMKDLKIDEEAKDAILKLSTRHRVRLQTSRKKSVEKLTRQWLQDNGLGGFHLDMSKERRKRCTISNIWVYIDDNMNFVRQSIKKGITVLNPRIYSWERIINTLDTWNDRILLYSGGVDSYCAWWHLAMPQTLFCNINHRYAQRELDAIKNTIPNTHIFSNIDLSFTEEVDANIPGRNLYLLQTAAWWIYTCRVNNSKNKTIFLISQLGEMSIPDRSIEFMQDAGRILSKLYDMNISVYTPYQYMTKQDLVSEYMQTVGFQEELKATVGCFSKHHGRSCGQCSCCFRRSVAFEANGIPLDDMDNDISKWNGIKEYIRKLKAGEYEEKRTIQTLAVLRKWGYDV